MAACSDEGDWVFEGAHRSAMTAFATTSTRAIISLPVSIDLLLDASLALARRASTR